MVAPIKNKPSVEAAFRQIIRGRTSNGFLAQKKTPSGADWQNALATLEQSSGGKLPKQLPALVAESIEIGKRSASQNLYRGKRMADGEAAAQGTQRAIGIYLCLGGEQHA
ncbi:hypothetical protein [Pararhizobium sp. PWRC1-1]|uniref:hypothetical protein n=1 Tax=Pararhizobium sp. PWRC1-1 TaxID=2804566 RepID=UPI003CF6910A